MERDVWIKVNREMLNTLSDEKFDKAHAWMDLLLRAGATPSIIEKQETKVSLERGELIASLRGLAKDWKWSKSNVERFLALLEVGHLIKTRKLHEYSVLRVENFEEKTQFGTPKDRIMGHEMGHLKTDINNKQSESYNSEKNKVGTPNGTPQEENEKEKKGFPPHPLYKEKEKEKEENFVVVDADAGAHTRTCEEQYPVNFFIAEMAKADIWIDAVCMKHHITPGDFVVRLQEFKTNNIVREIRHVSLLNAKRHFDDWLRIKLKDEKDERNRYGDRPTKEERDAEFARHIAAKLASC